MKLRSPVVLGLAFDERGVSCAEVAVKRGDAAESRRLGRFSFEPGKTPAEPAACGAALKAFLDEHGFDARKAILGVPARWLIANERDVPASDAASTLAVLRMHAERIALGGGGELVTDVAGDVTSQTTRALIVGVLKQQLDRLLAVAAAAELDVVAVTATSLAVHALADAGSQGTVILGEQGAEFVAGEPESPRSVRHLSAVNAATEPARQQLSADVRRTLALGGGGAGVRLVDSIGLPAGDRAQLAERMGVRPADPARASVGPDALNGAAGDRGPEAFAGAIALALSAAAPRGLPVDFTDTRLKPPIERRFGRKTVWGAILGATAALALGAMYWGVVSAESETAAKTAQLAAAKPDIDLNRQVVARLTTGRRYYDLRAPMLDVLKEVATVIHYDEPIWVSSVTVRDDPKGNGKVTIQGRATSQQMILTMLGRLQQNKKTILKPQLVESRAAGSANGRGSSEFTFSMTFEYDLKR